MLEIDRRQLAGARSISTLPPKPQPAKIGRKPRKPRKPREERRRHRREIPDEDRMRLALRALRALKFAICKDAPPERIAELERRVDRVLL